LKQQEKTEMKILNLIKLSDKEIKEMSKKIEWNKRELEFMKSPNNYFEFCKKYRHIENTISSYKAFDEDCEQWRNLAMGIILEDREQFNEN
jgi:hypothetical protein